jgi:PGF-CTERM protein
MPASGGMSQGDGPGFGAMIGLVAVVVAAVILVFFGIGYLLGRVLL